MKNTNFIFSESPYGDNACETLQFLNPKNRFFDCLNMCHLYEGRDTSNHDWDPYTDANDPQLHYLEKTFLGYFEELKISVTNRPNKFLKQHREKIQLSQHALDKLKITIRYIVACVRFLLKQGVPFVLREVFNQDFL